MDFELSHEQQLIVETARAFVEQELYPWALDKNDANKMEQINEL